MKQQKPKQFKICERHNNQYVSKCSKCIEQQTALAIFKDVHEKADLCKTNLGFDYLAFWGWLEAEIKRLEGK